jgi:hypothetical protein
MKTQQLLLANDLFPALKNGGKRVTIRKCRRDIQLGKLVFAPTTPDKKLKPVKVSVTEVRYKRLRDVTVDEAMADGFWDADHMYRGMKTYYPNLKRTDEVTFVIFTTK